MIRLRLSVSRTLLALSLAALTNLGCSSSDGGLGRGSGSGSGDDDSGGESLDTGTDGDGSSGSDDGLNISGGKGTDDREYIDEGTERVEAYQCNPKRFPQDVSCATENPENAFTTADASKLNWGEALQKALWFFGINKSGAGLFCTDTQWRGDSHVGDAQIKMISGDPNGIADMSQEYIEAHRAALDPDGNGVIDLSGGFHDAGDYIKFGLTTSYAATMLAWSMYEFPYAYEQTKLKPEAVALLKWFADYMMRSTFVENGEVIAYAHQVGDVSDHACGWMPPEVRLTSFCPRKAYFASEEQPAADQTAAAAAALALIGKVFHDNKVDEDYANQCLFHAMALYRFARKYPDTVADHSSFGLYEPEYSADKLAWAAIWLGVATGDTRYLDHVVGSMKGWQDPAIWSQGYLAQFPGFSSPANGWFECWTYVWRSVRTAVFTKYASVLNQITTGMAESRPERLLAKKISSIAREDALGWVDTPNVSPGGFAMKFTDTWGSGRYNSAGQFLSLVYAKNFPDDPRSDEIKTWAQGQMEYLLGKNPLNKSFMMGYTNKYCTQPHHAAGHASIYGYPDVPAENRHILYGALVNGPANLKDGHEDVRGDYGSNEVTIDYNAAFAAAIAGNYATMKSVQCPLKDFPPIEPRIDEFYTRDMVTDISQPCRTQTQITLVNETIHPPRYDEHLTARFYINVTELLDAGIDPSTITINMFRNSAGEAQGTTTMRGPVPCEVNGDIWYAEFSYEGAKFWGEIAKLTAPRTIQIDYGVENNPGCIWDPSNDYSTQLLNDWTKGGITIKEETKNPYVTVYSEGKLLYGEEPPCHPRRRIVVEPPDATLL